MTTYPLLGMTFGEEPMLPLAPIYTSIRRFRIDSIDAAQVLEELCRRFAPSSRSGPSPESHLFEFTSGGRRVSVLSHSPLYTLSVFDRRAVLVDHRSGRRHLVRHDGNSGLALLRTLLGAYCDPLPGLDGIAQSMLIMLGYDAARSFEPKLASGARGNGLPEFWATVPALSLAVDDEGRGVLVANSLHGPADPSVLGEFEGQVREVAAAQSAPRPQRSAGRPRFCTGRERYGQAVARAHEYIKAGDVFQVVLSLETVLNVDSSPLDIYRRMSRVNRRTANFVVESDGFSVVGASPEILLEKRGEQCIIKPLAGTLPHNGPPSSDLEARLLGNRKDCAEHRMLVDLARNDLGRVCRYGSIEARRLMDAEYFYNVIHISSEIRGRIREDRDALDLLKAGFPAGTMTGAPKIRAMEIIDELETRPRGFYSGGIGFLTPSDDLYTYILIRSLTLIDGCAYSRAGAGIVYDSRADLEYRECLSKMENSLRACRALESKA